MKQTGILRRHAAHERVTSIELFYDLVSVFAITQLSGRLVADWTAKAALQTGLLFAMVWLLWVYTTWMTNFLDPDQAPVRLALLLLMLASLAFSSAIPDAFTTRGLAIGICYAAMQVGRSVFAAVETRGTDLGRNFQRIGFWCTISGTLAVLGGLTAGSGRLSLWLAAVAVDLLGGGMGFLTPGLGRSTTGDWVIEGHHFAERCQGFLLIALGESIVAIGASVSGLEHVGVRSALGVLVAFWGCATLWWLYFSRSADDGAAVIAASSDPGRLGRSAYHYLHPVMVAGIVAVAAGDQLLIASPASRHDPQFLWLAIGGAGLFLVGHASFTWVVWRVVPWSRVAACAVLILLGLLAGPLANLVVGACVLVVLLAVAISDAVLAPERAVETPAP